MASRYNELQFDYIVCAGSAGSVSLATSDRTPTVRAAGPDIAHDFRTARSHPQGPNATTEHVGHMGAVAWVRTRGEEYLACVGPCGS